MKLDPLICLACKLGKAHQLTRSRNNTIIPDSITKPGDLIHTDQAESATPGRPMTISGKNNKIKVTVFTVFVDSISKKIFVEFQTSTNAEQTLKGKHRLEQSAAAFDVKIKHYRVDNGVFKSKEFKLDIEKQNQRISYSGVGAKWQNGVAERYIRTITERARTMLLHASTRWPDVITTELWTYAVNHAVDKWNCTPRKDLNFLTPDEIFAGVTTRDLNNPNMSDVFHTFGCPVLVLRHQLHEKKSLPKFEPRVQTGVFLGWSKDHARSVALVLNPKTDHISAQYHVIFDDNFETLNTTSKTTNIDQWTTIHKRNLATSTPIKTEFCSYENFLNPNPLSENSLHKGPNSDLLPSESPSLQRERRLSSLSSESQSISDAVSSSSSSVSSADLSVDDDESSDRNDKRSESEGQNAQREFPTLRSTRNVVVSRESTPRRGSHVFDPSNPTNSTGVRKSKRTRKPTLKVKETIQQVHAMAAELRSHQSKGKQFSFTEKVDKILELSSLNDGTFNDLNPHCFAASVNPNILTHRDAMKASDVESFREAMDDEVKRMIENKIFKEVPRSSVPMGQRILRAVWSHRRKTTPDGQIYRHRSRLCTDGSQQQYGIDYTETYSPVVSWTTVYILLILSVLLNLRTRQVDYVQAFPQATLPEGENVYMELPDGYDTSVSRSSTVLKIIRNIYGLKQAAFHWNELLTAGLLKLGFHQSAHDPCLFLKKDIICILYVDDSIFLSPKDSIIDEHIAALKDLDFDLTDEGDIEAFLGVKVQRDKQGHIKMSQPGLTDTILETLGLEKTSKCHDTPAVNPPLHAHENGAEREEKWNYRSVIGMLIYLARNTCPDIEYAVHQCARFQLNPKKAHENAVKRIGRYLLGTRDKGIIFTPQMEKLNDIQCYVDADFAGNYTKDTNSNPDSVKSRTGCVIKYAGCPITWFSRLQTEISLSTTEAEYIALSTAARELLPMREMFIELAKYLMIGTVTPIVRCELFEDNKGAETLANAPKMNARTKHIAIKYHHFREAVKAKYLQIKRVDTKEQLADILTKPVDRITLQHLRKGIMGWVCMFKRKFNGKERDYGQMRRQAHIN